MSTFDETQHARDEQGKFSEMAGSEQPDVLGIAIDPTVANTRVTLLTDGKPHAVRQPGSGKIHPISEAAHGVITAGDQLSTLGEGADGFDGSEWALRAEVLDPSGRAIISREIPCPVFGSLLVAEYQGDYMLVDDLDAMGVSVADPAVDWHHDKKLQLLPEERVDLEDVREWLTVSPGDGPYLVDACLDPNDPGKVDVAVMCTDSLTWNDEFTEEELDENYTIVEQIYREWFNADISVNEGWDTIDVTLNTSIDAHRASKLLILETTSGSYRKFRNETDPGTFGSDYVGSEIRRRIDARNAEKETAE